MSKKRIKETHPREMTHRALSHHKKAQRRQRIIFFSGVGIIVAVVLIIAGGWLAGEYLPMHQTILQIYDTKFDASFFIDTLVVYGRSQGSSSLSSLASGVANQIQQNELIRQEAAKMGISISDAEAEQYLQSIGFPINDASRELARGGLLTNKVQTEHFGAMVPTSENQVQVRAFLVESESVAQLVRDKIVSGENYTALAEQYAVDAGSKTVLGDYGWHPISVFKDEFFSNIPVDYISRPDAKAGDLSQPMSDNTAYKQLGYWLIRINSRPSEDSVNASAIYLGSEEEALAIRARLLAGEELGPIADKYSQYQPSKENHGEMELQYDSDNISNHYNAYVFNLTTETGKWSEPVVDNELYTQGGFWVVQIAGKEDNRAISTEDKDQLISTLYSNWVTEITQSSALFTINTLTDEIQQWAIDKAIAILNSEQQ